MENTVGQEGIDIEAIETGLQASLRKIGCITLENLLNAVEPNLPVGSSFCTADDHHSRLVGIRRKKMVTLFGTIELYRRYYYDADCKGGISPFDGVLDIKETMFSPGVRNMIGYVGASGTFAKGEEDLRRLAGLKIPGRSIERLCQILGAEAEAYRWKKENEKRGEKVKSAKTMYIEYDGTGIPVLKRETVGRKGKEPNGIAKTREIKVGCVFTQTRLDENGYPLRDERSTSYVAACESAADFSVRITHEADKRGVANAKRVCVLGDGAPWIWNIAADQFPTATQIVDLYHAREHYNEIAKMVFPPESKQLEVWMEKRKVELDRGNVKAVIRALVKLEIKKKSVAVARDNAVKYFRNNALRMQYARFRSAGLFVGSGVIEAGCKTLVGSRLKQSGMHWTVDSANNILALRCLLLSNQWDDFWEYRAAA